MTTPATQRKRRRNAWRAANARLVEQARAAMEGGTATLPRAARDATVEALTDYGFAPESEKGQTR